MFKRIAVVMAFLFCAGVAFAAFTSSIGSGKIGSSTVVVDKPCYIMAVHIRDDGTNALTVAAYDSSVATTDTDKLIGEYKIEAGGARASGWVWNYPRKCERGIYLYISGGTGWATVEYNFN